MRQESPFSREMPSLHGRLPHGKRFMTEWGPPIRSEGCTAVPKRQEINDARRGRPAYQTRTRALDLGRSRRRRARPDQPDRSRLVPRGPRVHVNFAAPPLVAVRVSHQGDEVFVSSNEQQRLLAEELPAGVSLSTRAWHEALPALPGLTEADVARELRDARRHLLPVELSQYRSLSKDVSAVLTDALTAVDPAASERELAASVTRALTALGADPLVVLVAGHSRVSFRRPLPTDAPLGRRAMLIVCARRHGMIANATRWVRFGPADARETDAEARILDVEAAMLAATVPGAQLNQILAEAASAYSRAGFHAEEWTMHHQGGPAGYDGRDPRATPTD